MSDRNNEDALSPEETMRRVQRMKAEHCQNWLLTIVQLVIFGSKFYMGHGNQVKMAVQQVSDEF